MHAGKKEKKNIKKKEPKKERKKEGKKERKKGAFTVKRTRQNVNAKRHKRERVSNKRYPQSPQSASYVTDASYSQLTSRR